VSRDQKKTVHAHGCKRCRRRYEDNCKTPTKNGTCLSCTSGHPPPIWVLNRDPKDCCRVHARRTRKEETAPYLLAGDEPWFICRICARTFAYDPGATT
jgi:hypothetical protein